MYKGCNNWCTTYMQDTVVKEGVLEPKEWLIDAAGPAKAYQRRDSSTFLDSSRVLDATGLGLCAQQGCNVWCTTRRQDTVLNEGEATTQGKAGRRSRAGEGAPVKARRDETFHSLCPRRPWTLPVCTRGARCGAPRTSMTRCWMKRQDMQGRGKPPQRGVGDHHVRRRCTS